MKVVDFFLQFRKKHPLAVFITTRTLSMLVTLFVLGFAVFGLMALTPGDIIDSYVKQELLNSSGANGSRPGKDKNLFDEQEIAAAKARLGLDKPFYIQYFNWLHQVIVKHDLGRSLISRAPILFLVKDRLINSLILNVISLIFITVISFAIGIYF